MLGGGDRSLQRGAIGNQCVIEQRWTQMRLAIRRPNLPSFIQRDSALRILARLVREPHLTGDRLLEPLFKVARVVRANVLPELQIGRASCRERVCQYV